VELSELDDAVLVVLLDVSEAEARARAVTFDPFTGLDIKCVEVLPSRGLPLP
jgi:hypothetical protein